MELSKQIESLGFTHEGVRRVDKMGFVRLRQYGLWKLDNFQNIYITDYDFLDNESHIDDRNSLEKKGLFYLIYRTWIIEDYMFFSVEMIQDKESMKQMIEDFVAKNSVKK